MFSPTVLEDVAFGPLNLGKSKKEALDLAENTLASLDLSSLQHRTTMKLSGGEKRLVALATILAMEPEVLLLDEPTTGLDSDTQKKLIDILRKLEVSYILISHYMDFLAQLTTTIYSLSDGHIHTDKTAQLHSHFHLHEHGTHPHQHEHQ